jgi:hypothetical protein
MSPHLHARQMSRAARWLAAAAMVLAGGCGSVDVQTPAGGAGGSASPASSTSAGAAGAGGADAGWTACESPAGFEVCGASLENCPPDEPGCRVCTDPSLPISVCGNDAFYAWGQPVQSCPGAKDSGVCLNTNGPETGYPIGVPWDIGALYGANGFGTWVRYEDWGLWTGDPLPEPAVCPNLPGINICGGHCGGCPPDTYCTGRSPLHPYGICVPTKLVVCGVGSLPCGAGLGCFVYKVQPEAQAYADEWGICFPQATCENMAANLPGGGTCTTP